MLGFELIYIYDNRLGILRYIILEDDDIEIAEAISCIAKVFYKQFGIRFSLIFLSNYLKKFIACAAVNSPPQNPDSPSIRNETGISSTLFKHLLKKKENIIVILIYLFSSNCFCNGSIHIFRSLLKIRRNWGRLLKTGGWRTLIGEVVKEYKKKVINQRMHSELSLSMTPGCDFADSPKQSLRVILAKRSLTPQYMGKFHSVDPSIFHSKLWNIHSFSFLRLCISHVSINCLPWLQDILCNSISVVLKSVKQKIINGCMFYEESSEDIISEPSQCLDYSQLIQTSFSSADISEMSSTASDGYDQSSATTLLDFPLESMNVFLMFIFELAKRTVMLKKKLFCGFFETLLFGK
ncbi:hypothetical protein ADUPG1_010564, partial [Aduncisulcus paluster]